jgi:hypothetical protein
MKKQNTDRTYWAENIYASHRAKVHAFIDGTYGSC